MELFTFLVSVVAISLSGVMAPGPITAAAIAKGATNKYAGALMALGHGVVEVPLILLLMLGLAKIFESQPAQIAIGILGGLFLLYMGASMIKDVRKPDFSMDQSFQSGAFTCGVVLSGTNPYFLFWWASVGLGLVIAADKMGYLALILFAVIHWLCDLVWLTILSFAAHTGTNLLKPRVQRYLLGGCGAVLGFFGLSFLFDAARRIMAG